MLYNIVMIKKEEDPGHKNKNKHKQEVLDGIDRFTVVLFNLLSSYFIIIFFLLHNFKCFDLDFSEL